MIADYPRALNEGFVAISADLRVRLEGAAGEQAVTLESMLVACQAPLRLAERHAEAAQRLAALAAPDVRVAPIPGLPNFPNRASRLRPRAMRRSAWTRRFRKKVVVVPGRLVNVVV